MNHDYVDETDVDAIRGHGLDVLVRLGFRILQGPVLKAARYGIWSFHHDDNDRYRGGPPGVWEVLEGAPTTGAILQRLMPELDGGVVLAKGVFNTQPFSVICNRAYYYPRVAAMLPRTLKALSVRGQAMMDECMADASSEYVPYCRPLYRTSGITDAMVVRLMARWFRAKVASLFFRARFRSQWQLAYCIRPHAPTPERAFFRMQPLVPPRDRFWADPFCVHDARADRYYIFFEDYRYGMRRGRISCIEMSTDGQASESFDVLERPYHLSYPFVFQWDGAYYMIPDSSSNSTVDLYRADSFPTGWTLDTVLFEGVRTADTTLYFDGQVWWMFACSDTLGVGAIDELYLYWAETPRGPWTEHPRNPVVTDVRRARPAGALFRVGDTLYRPSQDCAGQYGSRTVINRVLQLDKEHYREHVVDAVAPDWDANMERTHTLNSSGRMTVIDYTVKRRKR
jgi:hypothetical protein